MSKKRKIYSIKDMDQLLLNRLLKAVKSYNLKVNLLLVWNIIMTIILILFWFKR